MAHDTMIEEPWEKILAGISRLLVYPSTLRYFTKAVRSLTKLDWESLETLEDILQSNSNKVWTRWTQTKAWAYEIKSYRRVLKEKGALWLCIYERAIYCSRACQRPDWANGHRNQCKIASSQVDDTDGSEQYELLDWNEVHFFLELTKFMVQKHTRHIAEEDDDLLKGRGKSTPDLRMLKRTKKNPIVLVDFEMSFASPTTDDVYVIHPNSLECFLEPRFEEDSLVLLMDQVIERWLEPEYNQDTILVVGLFASGKRGSPIHIDHLAGFPLVTSGVGAPNHIHADRRLAEDILD
ncbi:hypothetical protein AAF712_012611 [Marasmius tenuissimus]|uniref:MYND-type domain-containing protein n=1 Tax=Marasmius tenuissimus TaxID=585030 RepID=A0ABR2ZGY1_9AGAR